MSQNQPLTLDEFPIPSYEEWKAEAVASLKGAPFEKKLITKTLEGIELQPIYNQEDLEGLAHLGTLPGQAPYVRGTKAGNSWKIFSEMDCNDPEIPGFEPICKWVRGMLDKPFEEELKEIATWNSVAVNAMIYHNSGGNAVQELAFALATGVEYLRQGESLGVDVETMAGKIKFSFAAGADFFMAIAKLRALRLLWAKVVAACGGSAEAQKARLFVSTSRWNRSKLDPYVNMLRDTTEALSAALAGADIINVNPFDSVVREPDEFSERIARNTQLILKEECHFDHVADPAGGSYYVEVLTAKLAEAAWTLFQEVEKAGGMIEALKAGIPQQQVKAAAKKKAGLVAQRRLSLIGVNVYANPTEKPLEGKAPAPCRAGTGKVPSGIETLARVRGAEPFENLRAAVGASPKNQVFLVNMGPLRQFKARADFSTGFFQAGGFKVLENRGFKTPGEALEAAKASGAPVAIICSTDDTYPELVPALAPALKAAGLTVILAGYPAEQIEAFRQAGVDEFIHIRANCYEVLSGIATQLGIL